MIVIDLQNQDKARILRKLLLSVPFESKLKIRIARSTEHAQKLCKKRRIDCVIYQREYTDKLESYFDKYIFAPKWFMPYSQKQDNNDIIEAINTQRTAYYIVEPLDTSKTAQALNCIKIRI